jgi:hypothetical protein
MSLASEPKDNTFRLVRFPISGGRDMIWLLLKSKLFRFERFPSSGGRSVSKFFHKDRYHRLVRFLISGGRIISRLFFKDKYVRLVRFPSSGGRIISWLRDKYNVVRSVKFHSSGGSADKFMLSRLREVELLSRASRIILLTGSSSSDFTILASEFFLSTPRATVYIYFVFTYNILLDRDSSPQNA